MRQRFEVFSVSLSEEAVEYYSGYDLSLITDALLSTYNIMQLPPCTRDKSKQRRVTVTNVPYLEAVARYGARSNLLSLTRLLEYGVDVNFLSSPQCRECHVAEKVSKVRTSGDVRKCLSHILHELKELELYTESDTDMMRVCTEMVELVKKYKIKEKEENGV